MKRFALNLPVLLLSISLMAQNGQGTNGEALKTYSKYDFVTGEKLMGYEDFSDVEIGDFPKRWNTNGSAEVVSLNNKEGKWLKISKEAVFHPEFITSLPENFTLEFDLGVNNDWNSNAFVLNIASLKSPKDYTDYYHYINWTGSHAVHLELKPAVSGGNTGYSKIQTATDGNYIINNENPVQTWNNTTENFAHVALWRQNTRLRVYVNGEKVWDLAKAFDPATKYNAVTFASSGSSIPEDFFLLNNIRMAIGAPDTRNKLMTEGKFVTSGIKFDSNSDRIKPDSYGVLKAVADVLKENASVKIRIVGHTDSDGDDKANLDLSKRRAEAVKSFLNSQFVIDASRMETDGLGETKPVADNKTPESKAQNRRVEFIKL